MYSLQKQTFFWEILGEHRPVPYICLTGTKDIMLHMTGCTCIQAPDTRDACLRNLLVDIINYSLVMCIVY